ncbi:hypothetical protein OG349_17125 [Streptomyces sp. NBC_01317]|uniref:hypothetical protein n=1 Tax=Streptomyces sp. NBC_01317 TaxID=2903822 RepID=UPI002E0F051F|nr:hypothetical protein OG349_17125 [Streptomyces sp. NBC_01317]
MNDDNEQSGHSTDESGQVTTPVAARGPWARRLLSKKSGGLVVAAGLTCAVAGLTGAGTSSAAGSTSSPSVTASETSATSTPTPTATPTPKPSGPAGGGPVADPAPGGATGIVDTVSTSGFTFSTATGVKVTVDKGSTTTYEKGTHRTSARAVRKGTSVLVLGTVDSATITATKVVVQPGGDGGAAAAKAAGVIPFQKGTPSPDKSVGQIPDYTEGEGTIVSGKAADNATKAAQAVVPGGINDRVVKLSNGEYEVHNISVNWPHHVFVSKDYKVLGYE